MNLPGVATADQGLTVAIMQPYFMPYIGYFQLINCADLFVVYDNIKYTKKGWINRNRMLQGNSDILFSIPLRKDSDSKDIRERELAPDFNKAKFLNQIRENYRKSPYFEPVFALMERVMAHDEANLFCFLHHSIVETCRYLGIDTKIVVSSTIDIDHSLLAQDKVLALSQSVGANVYVNPIGGVELYSWDSFSSKGIELAFLQSKPIEYPQFGGPFIPWLSIIDVMMFNSLESIREYLTDGYSLINGNEAPRMTAEHTR